jgi:Bacterial lectin
MLNRTKASALASVFALAMAAAAAAQQGVIEHSQGFTGQTDMTLNGTPSIATINGTKLQVTSGAASLARSAFHTAAVPVTNFQTRFTFHLLQGSSGAGVNKADGMGFCIQGNAPTALGGNGGNMGYNGVLKSILIKFDNYNGSGVYSATGMYQNGATPTDLTNDINCLPNIDFQGEHDFSAVMSYDGVTLTVTLKDLTTNNTLTQTYTVDIPTLVGAATGFVGFCGGTGGLNAVQEVMTWSYGAGPAPTNLAVTDGRNQEMLNWTAVAGATTYQVFSSPTSGGPYTQIGTSNTNSYTDNTAQYPSSYYYVVLAVSPLGNSLFSNEVLGVPLQPAVTVSPASVTTSETGGNAPLTLTVNAAPSGAASITLTSSDATKATLSYGGQTQNPITIDMTGAAAGAVFTVTVVGVDDFIAQPANQTYTISFTVNGGGTPWGTLTSIPSVNGTHVEGDVAALLVNPSSGLITDTSGGQASFAVRLSTIPQSGLVTLTVASSNPSEGTVNPASLTFTNSTWSTPQTVFVTGQGTNLTYQDQAYSVTVSVDPGSDGAYLNMSSTVQVLNRHLEVPPALPHVWGGNSGGGCGLTGLEAVLLLCLGAAWRRRRQF